MGRWLVCHVAPESAVRRGGWIDRADVAEVPGTRVPDAEQARRAVVGRPVGEYLVLAAPEPSDAEPDAEFRPVVRRFRVETVVTE